MSINLIDKNVSTVVDVSIGEIHFSRSLCLITEYMTKVNLT